MNGLEEKILAKIQEGEIMLIDKPLDWTSFDVVKKIRWRIKDFFNIKKIKVGHAGTLDPKATGLLIVCTGKATKKIQEIQDAPKVYTGTIKIGVQTPSFDTETDEFNFKEYSHLNKEDIERTTLKFIGDEIMQKPPIYSAIKKDGVRLYELARKGETTEINHRKISIYDFKITEINLPFLNFYIHCSKGTYIRSIANDFGNELGVGAYLTSLRREKIGNYDVNKSSNNIIINNKYFENLSL